MAYHENDHVALAQDLALFKRLDFQIIRAIDLVQSLHEGTFTDLPSRSVVITFDDGPNHDVQDTVHPLYGPQRGMRGILQDAACGASATSFVIASPQARAELSHMVFGVPDGYSHHWWSEAQAGSEIDIGTHSWNHVHPEVSEIALHPELAGAFHHINTEAEAQRQVVLAAQTVWAQTGRPAARLFAYPYGQYNEFLVHDFLPRQSEIIAAFTTEPRYVTTSESIWMLPRYVCGHHWKSPAELEAILMGATCSAA